MALGFINNYVKLRTANDHQLFVCHLSSNFLSEVLVLLLKTFTCLESYEALDIKLASVVLCNLSYVLSNIFLILSLNISLINKADLLKVL